MSGAGFVLAINICLGGLFAVVFLLIARYGPSYRSAKWVAAAFGIGTLAVAMEFVLTLGQHLHLLYSIGFALYLASIACAFIAMRRRRSAEVPWLVLAIFFGGSIAINAFLFGLGRESMLRLYAYQVPLIAMYFMTAATVFGTKGGKPIERFAGIGFTLSGLQGLIKPVLAQMLGGPGASPADYAASQYAAYSQTIGAILAVATALVLIMSYVGDIVEDMRADAVHDELTGLVNRRGFLQWAEAARAAEAAHDKPAAMIVADLDDLKIVANDFGAAGRDGVVRAFGEVMRAAAEAEPDGIMGRMGLGEFAAYLPQANVACAQAVAEGARQRLQGMAIAGLPQDYRITASFGVAEARQNEAAEDLMLRAREALFAAKRSGGNRVSLAPFISLSVASHSSRAI